MDRNHILHHVKEKNDMCDYNTKYFMSLGWMIDDIVMNLFMNKAHTKIRFNNNLFTKIEDISVILYKVSIKYYTQKKATHDSIYYVSSQHYVKKGLSCKYHK